MYSYKLCMHKVYNVLSIGFIKQSSLSVLGIPLSDVLRILAAVLLLGNIEFVEGPGLELDIVGNNGELL